MKLSRPQKNCFGGLDNFFFLNVTQKPSVGEKIYVNQGTLPLEQTEVSLVPIDVLQQRQYFSEFFMHLDDICSTLLFSSGKDEENLKVNKYAYSLLLRSAANKNLTLLERTDVILNILQQLTQDNEGNNLGIQ